MSTPTITGGPGYQNPSRRPTPKPADQKIDGVAAEILKTPDAPRSPRTPAASPPPQAAWRPFNSPIRESGR